MTLQRQRSTRSAPGKWLSAGQPTSASSSACRNRERSALANGAGPPTMSPPARKSAMIARVAMALPMLAAVNGLPLWPMTRRAGLQAAVGEQDVAGDDHRPRVGPLGDPVVGGVERVRHQHPLDQRMIGHADAAVADHLSPRTARGARRRGRLSSLTGQASASTRMRTGAVGAHRPKISIDERYFRASSGPRMASRRLPAASCSSTAAMQASSRGPRIGWAA